MVQRRTQISQHTGVGALRDLVTLHALPAPGADAILAQEHPGANARRECPP